MSFVLSKNSGIPAKYQIEGYTDYENDIQSLKTNFGLGSQIKVIESGKTYVLMENGWTYMPTSAGNLDNYYTKEETDNLIRQATLTRFVSVDVLPTTNIQTNVIYLVPKNSGETGNIKEEYINLDGTTAGWEKIGDTEIDLDGYIPNEGNTTSDNLSIKRNTVYLGNNAENDSHFLINNNNGGLVHIEGVWRTYIMGGDALIDMDDYILLRPGPNQKAYYGNDSQGLRNEMEIATIGNLSTKLDKTGGQLTGQLTTTQTLFTEDNQLVTKKYVDDNAGGTSDYTDLTNKPSINNVTLSANKTLNDLGIGGHDNYTKTSLYNGAFNTAGGTITLAESIENFDMLIVELATIGDNIVMNRNNMPIFTNEIVYEDRISYDQAITLGTVHSTIRYCFTDSTTLKVKDIHSTNFAEFAPYITKVDGIAYGARRPYKETILYNGGTTAAVGKVQLAKPITDFDAVTMVFGKPDGSSWVKNMFTYPTSTIPNGWTPEYGPIGLYVENDNITFGWNNGNQMYPLKVVGINYGGSVKGRNVTSLYTAADTTAPSTITLSQAYTDFDELVVSYNVDGLGYMQDNSYQTRDLNVGNQIGYTTDRNYFAYTFASATLLNNYLSNINGFISKIYGIKYDSDYITIDSEMSATSENPVQNKVIKAYVDGAIAAITDYETEVFPNA